MLPVLAGGCGPAREDTAPIPASGDVVEIERTADGEGNSADACVDGHC